MEEVVEIYVEEASMENFLRALLPSILPEKYRIDENLFIRPHEGKSHLQKSIPKKMRAFSAYPYKVKLIVLHDQDSNDCKVLKDKLVRLIQQGGDIPFLVRIACRELKNWYLGDLPAVEQVYPESKASRFADKSKFRRCDSLNGAEKMERLSTYFTKSFASREIPKHMNIYENKSVSFNHFVDGIRSFLDI